MADERERHPACRLGLAAHRQMEVAARLRQGLDVDLASSARSLISLSLSGRPEYPRCRGGPLISRERLLV